MTYAKKLKDWFLLKMLENTKHQNRISYTRIQTPLGQVYAGAVDEGICFLEFSDDSMPDNQIKQIAKHFNAELISEKNMHLTVLDSQLEEYFNRKRKTFEIPLAVAGTEFQRKAWKMLCTIPYGETVSYENEAALIGNKKAVRAAARANSANPISILIPCHRVIAKSGKISGYTGGIWRKQYLLTLEKENNTD